MNPSLLDYHRTMITDPVRMGAWREAIQRTVKAGDVVVDIGAGTGVLSFLACAAGARRVYAVEQEDIIEVARESAGKSGMDGRIVFVTEPSLETELPEPADVVLADVFGAFGLDGNLLATMIDARQRFLRPGGRLLPYATELFCAPVELADFYQRTIAAWDGELSGVDAAAGRQRLVNAMHRCFLGPEAALSKPASLGRVELREVSQPSWGGRAAFTLERSGTLHGVAGWCSAWLTPEIRTSNSPFSGRRLAWRQAVFPIETPVVVQAGDTIEAAFEFATHGAWLVWNWAVNAQAAKPARFRHSTLSAETLSLDGIRRQSPAFVPRLSKRGEAGRTVLALSDGSRTLGEIRDEILRRFPQQFSSRSQAHRFVARLLSRLGA